MKDIWIEEAAKFIEGYCEEKRPVIPGYDDITDCSGLYTTLKPSMVGPRVLANLLFAKVHTLVIVDGINGGGKSSWISAFLKYLKAKITLIDPQINCKDVITTIPSRSVYAATREVGMPHSSMPGAFTASDYQAIHKKAEIIIPKLIHSRAIGVTEFNGSGERGEDLNLKICSHLGPFEDLSTSLGRTYDWVYVRVIGSNPIQQALNNRPDSATPEDGKPYFGGGGKRGTKLGILSRYKDVWKLHQEKRIKFEGPPPPNNILDMSNDQIYPYLNPLMSALGYDEPKDFFERKLSEKLNGQDVKEVITDRVTVVDLDRINPPAQPDDEVVIEELDRVRDIVDTLRYPTGRTPLILNSPTIDPNILGTDFLRLVKTG